MLAAAAAWDLFEEAVRTYHRQVPDDASADLPWDLPCPPVPTPADEFSELLWKKAWVDTVQWHAEDRIRHPRVEPALALQLKRRIDALNQERTDRVEALDDFMHARSQPSDGAQESPSWKWIPTETPAWALDRLSILALKILHMHAEVERSSASAEHRQFCQAKLDVLLFQKGVLISAIDALWHAICAGDSPYHRYRQMKMYNDPALNPVLYRTLD